jgi:hypothetical protein
LPAPMASNPRFPRTTEQTALLVVEGGFNEFSESVVRHTREGDGAARTHWENGIRQWCGESAGVGGTLGGYDADLGELTVAAVVPPPSSVFSVKAYRYVAASGQIRETVCTQKEQRDRYNGAVAAVAIRTFHEVFESDHEERIMTISLTVQTETINPAPGLVEQFPFVGQPQTVTSSCSMTCAMSTRSRR